MIEGGVGLIILGLRRLDEALGLGRVVFCELFGFSHLDLQSEGDTL